MNQINDIALAREALLWSRLSEARVCEARGNITGAVVNLCKSLRLTDDLEQKEQTRAKINSLLKGKREYVYLIAAMDYRYTSSGIKVLHLLCHMLNELGEQAYLLPVRVNKNLNTPILTEEIYKKLRADGKLPIHLAPESIEVDLNAEYLTIIARWLLYKVGIWGETGRVKFEHFTESEDITLFYHYHADFINERWISKRLNILAEDLSIFYPPAQDVQRQGVYYYAFKYYRHSLRGKVSQTLLDGGAVSLGFDNPHHPKELAEIFRTARVLYCYDISAIMTEALLCGCPVVLVKTPSTESFLNDISDNRIFAYWAVIHEEEIDISQDFEYDVDAFNRDYRLDEEESAETVKGFIKQTKAAMDYFLDNGELEGFDRRA